MNDFINQLCDKGTRVRVWTINGYQMSGVITRAEDDYILLNVGGVESMIYVHAISTIRPEG